MTNKQMLAILVTTAMATAIASSSYAADARPVRSQPVSLGKGDFWLLVMDGKLHLQKQSEQAVQTSELAPTVFLIKPGEDSIPWEVATKDMTYRQVALARWKSHSLCAVIVFEHLGKQTFWCITIHNPNDCGVSRIKAYAVCLKTTDLNYRVVSLSGDQEGDRISILAGAFDENTDLSEGFIMVHSCPYPAAIGAKIGDITVKYSKSSNEK